MNPNPTPISALSAVFKIRLIPSDGGQASAGLVVANEELDQALSDLAAWRAKGGFEPDWRAAVVELEETLS